MIKIISFFVSFLPLLNSLSVNSTYMNKYNDFIIKYNKEFSYERFLQFKENIEQINKLENTVGENE